MISWLKLSFNYPYFLLILFLKQIRFDFTSFEPFVQFFTSSKTPTTFVDPMVKRFSNMPDAKILSDETTKLIQSSFTYQYIMCLWGSNLVEEHFKFAKTKIAQMVS